MITVHTREDFLKALYFYLPHNCDAVEIGVCRGEFANEILRIINPDTLVLVDTYVKNDKKYSSGLTTAYSTEDDYNDLISLFENEIKGGKIIIDRRFSFDAVKGYADFVFDVAYIDGSHLYEDVKRDLNEWLPKIKKDSVLAGHDYIDCEDFGVIRAVDEFCEEHGFEMIIFNDNGGDWALKRKQ